MRQECTQEMTVSWKPRKESVSSRRKHLTMSKVADVSSKSREVPKGLGSMETGGLG